MFATLLGGLPRPPVEDGEDPVAVGVRAQEEAGLEPITDGRLGDPSLARLGETLLADAIGSRDVGTDAKRTRGGGGSAVEGWRAAAGLTDRAVKQALPGPYTLGRRLADHAEASRVGDRHILTLALAEALHREVEALAAAGCLLVEIEESDAHRIGADEAERELFRRAHRILTDGETATHLSLSIVGGSAAGAGIDTILDAPYASLAVDLIAGPDNWNLVTRLPGDRGVIVGVQAGREQDQSNAEMLFAVRYAASTRGRGVVRVGIGSAGSWANLTWEAALRKLRRLGEAARLASMPPSEELARSLDPRAVSSRRAALGHDAPRPKRGRR